MISKEIKKITKKDLISLEQYSKNRSEIRKDIIKYKKNRRVQLGPYASFYFECYKTMLAQVQEMLYIEKGGEKQIEDELNAYNPLVPNGKELVATLMFEIDNPVLRNIFLNKIGGIEKKIYLKIGLEKIYSLPEKDVERTSEEGKSSSVHFVHFNFAEDQIKKFKDTTFSGLSLGIEHSEYSHETTISNSTRISLSEDFY